MFNLFSKKNYFIGIDVGTAAIKIVELSYKNQKPYLENYGWVAIDFIKSNKQFRFKSYEEKIKIYLGHLVKKIKLKSKSAYISIPGFSGLIALIELPEMKETELKQAIHFEARKYIPTPLEEVFLGWEIVGRSGRKKTIQEKYIRKNKNSGSKDRKVQILLVAAPKAEIIKSENILRSIGLESKTVELEIFALVRAVVGDDLGSFLIVDIGSRACNIVFVEKGMVKVSRSIEAGGNEVTNTISESMNISKERAESLKKTGKDFIDSKESAIVLPTLELVTNEVKRIMNAYKEKNGNMNLDGIILSGGTAQLTGAASYFERILGVKTTISNPWKRIVYDPILTPKLESLEYSFSIAIGLAMRGIEDYCRDN